MKLVMTKGLPGSGKTTWAKHVFEVEPNTVLVCKDDLRAMLFCSAWTRDREKFVLQMRDFVVSSGLKAGKNVIVHDTNLAPKHEERLKQLAHEAKAEFEVKDFTWVSVEECIKNDLKRLNSVGEKVIRDMYRDFLKPKSLVYERIEGLPEAVICDIDGTLALFGDANPYDRDFLQDKLNPSVGNVLSTYRAVCGDGWGVVKIIIVSGRKDKYKAQTEEWLHKNNVYYDALYMRKTLTDGQPEPKDVVVKKEIYETYIKGKYNVLFVLDDRNQVVEFWRSEGLTCLQVAEGDF